MTLTFLSAPFTSVFRPYVMQDEFPGISQADVGTAVHTMDAKLRVKYKGCTIAHDKSTGERGTVEICAWPSQIAEAQKDCLQILLSAVAAPAAKKYPPTWGAGPHKYEIESKEVVSGNYEHADVLEQLRATIPHARLIKLERIQRPKL